MLLKIAVIPKRQGQINWTVIKNEAVSLSSLDGLLVEKWGWHIMHTQTDFFWQGRCYHHISCQKIFTDQTYLIEACDSGDKWCNVEFCPDQIYFFMSMLNCIKPQVFARYKVKSDIKRADNELHIITTINRPEHKNRILWSMFNQMAWLKWQKELVDYNHIQTSNTWGKSTFISLQTK